jgi:hypothetical protein
LFFPFGQQQPQPSASPDNVSGACARTIDGAQDKICFARNLPVTRIFHVTVTFVANRVG